MIDLAQGQRPQHEAQLIDLLCVAVGAQPLQYRHNTSDNAGIHELLSDSGASGEDGECGQRHVPNAVGGGGQLGHDPVHQARQVALTHC